MINSSKTKLPPKLLLKIIVAGASFLIGTGLFVVFKYTLKLQKDATKEPWLIKKYGFENLKKAYPNWDDASLFELLKETSDWPMIYEPFTGISHAEKTGRFINYNFSGFRESAEKNTWPPDFRKKTIFIFGGSTVLGAGVPDGKTIPSLVQQKLKKPEISVYNFGRGFYFSTQEKILFLQLLESQHRPTLVIFIHGLNDFYFFDGNPEFTEKISNLFTGENSYISLNTKTTKKLSEAQKVEQVVERLLENRKQTMAICKAYGIEYLEVIQPVPLYKYSSKLFIIPAPSKHDFGRHYLHKLGYKKINLMSEFNTDNKNLLNLSKLLAEETEVSYCDLVHYTEKTNELIAKKIQSHIAKYFDEL